MQDLVGFDKEGNVLLKPLSDLETQFQTLQNHVTRIDQRLNALDAKTNTNTANINTNKSTITNVNNLVVLKTKHLTRKCPAKFWNDMNLRMGHWTPYKTPDVHACAMTCPTDAFTYRVSDEYCFCRHWVGKVPENQKHKLYANHISGQTCDYK